MLCRGLNTSENPKQRQKTIEDIFPKNPPEKKGHFPQKPSQKKILFSCDRFFASNSRRERGAKFAGNPIRRSFLSMKITEKGPNLREMFGEHFFPEYRVTPPKKNRTSLPRDLLGAEKKVSRKKRSFFLGGCSVPKMPYFEVFRTMAFFGRITGKKIL